MSEGSVSTTSSRITQFGLYRTIDARTEEFLRLSRKRQLKQGCACAAVSTAITVTIVVTVILIYEYGNISEFSSKSTLRPNWLELMNTSEAMPFEAKFNKASINLESSIRLLPLVLKALKKNRYYDNIMADDSSPSPLYDNKETDDLLTKNVFSDTRNWMRIPSRIYAIEYKTSPIVYYKNPTRNTDYFTKIRRIRDYQRIMNYVDKMISDKITGSTMPMLKSTYSFDKNLHIPPTTAMPSMNYKTKHNLQRKQKKITTYKKPKCTCPKKMNDLLNKMVITLHKLLPNATHDIMKMPKPCDNSQKHIINNVTGRLLTTSVNSDSTTSRNTIKNVKNSNAFSESKDHFQDVLPIAKKTNPNQAENLLKSLPSKVDYTLQTIIKLIRPKTYKANTMINDLKLLHSKIIRPTEESTEDYYYSPEDKIKPITILETSSTMLPQSVTNYTTNIIVSEDPLNAKDLTSSKITTSSTSNEKTDNDYLIDNTTPNIANSFNSLDVHSLELVKSKLIPKKIEPKTKGDILENDVHSKVLQYENGRMFKNSSLILGLLRKMGQLIKSESEKSETYAEEPIDDVSNHVVSMNISNKKTDYLHAADSIPFYSQTIQYFTTTPRNTEIEKLIDKNESDLNFKIDDETLEDEEEKMFYEESLNSNNLKKLEKIINTLNKTDNKPHKTNIEIPLYQWENIIRESIEDNSTEETTKYNIPKSRPSYLEIQRTDWKHEEQQDYDNNVVLLIYEYMITVETSLVQNKRRFNSNDTQNDLPIADKLDRRDFGFDQDYYEKMPLLVNGLQEVNYVDPSVDIAISSLKTNKKTKTIYIRPTKATNLHKFIKRTSPRPFVFEYKSPYPKPFSKINGNPKNWVERYRNAERLKNLQEVIKYLEKTLHAKFGDMYLPNKAQIAFSGDLMSSLNTEDVASYSAQNEEIPQSSRKVEVRTNHQTDRLYTYRPDNPGDVNLLADGFRFSPTTFSTMNRKKNKSTLPKFRSFPDISKTCSDNECNKNDDINIEKTINLPSSLLIKSSILSKNNKPNSVNLMLNLMPLQGTDSNKNENEREKIYITTSKPLFHYKRKIKYPVRRTFLRSDRLKLVMGKRQNDYEILKKKYESPKVLLNFNVYSTPKRGALNVPKMTEHSNFDFVSTSTAATSTKKDEEIKFDTDYPVPNFSSIEDYHIGSSGVIPIELLPTSASFPLATPLVPMPSTTTTTETVFTNPSEIFKFSPEDAKIPDQYRNIENSEIFKLEDVRNYSSYGKFSKSDKQEVIAKTLLIKLRNIAETTTEEVSPDDSTSNVETTTNIEIGIATGTYVPQINGHYRNMRHKTLTRILQESSERYRRKRLENLLTTPKSTYVPTMYPPHKTSPN